MVWECVTIHGVGRLCKIDGNMNSKKYISILQEAYLGTVKDLQANPHGFTLQADNDSKHTSKATCFCLEKNHIPTLSWPTNSPDMNIMENLWAYLKGHVRAHPKKPSNFTELQNVIQEEWNKISPEYVRKLYESMSRCVE